MYKQHRLIGLECGELSGSIINQKEEEEEEDSVRPAKRFTTKKKKMWKMVQQRHQVVNV